MAASSEQLADYAFTVRGHAYPIDDVFKQRDIPQFFATKKLSSVSWKERTKSTPPAINTEAEKKTPGPDESQVIFVGLFPSNANEETLTKKLASVKGRVGYALPRDAAFVVQPTQGSPAFRVVTMNKSAIPVGGMKYYVLMEKDHQTDLWYGFTIPQELVFFFPEYRHPSTKLVERTKDWTQKVLASCKTGSDTRGQSVSHCTYMGTQNEQNLARLHIELAKFHLTQDPSALDVIKNIVDKNDHPKTQLKSLILLFLDIDRDFNEEHAVALDTKIKQHWTRLGSIVSASRLLTLHDCIATSAMKIDFKCSKTFIVLGCTMLAAGKSNSQRVASNALLFAQTLLANGNNYDFAIPSPQKALVKDIFVALLTKMRPLTTLLPTHMRLWAKNMANAS